MLSTSCLPNAYLKSDVTVHSPLRRYLPPCFIALRCVVALKYVLALKYTVALYYSGSRCVKLPLVAYPRILALCALFGISLQSSNSAQTVEKPEDVKAALFEQQILPILREHCFDCHSHEAGEAGGKLMLDSLVAMTEGGTRGSAVVPGDASQSVLVQAVSYSDSDLQMPPDEKLPDEAIELLRKWILDGAHVPDNLRGNASQGGSASLDTAASHWAYQPPQRYAPVSNAQNWILARPEGPAMSATLLDQILAQGLADAGIDPSPRADRRTLLRRLSYDLIGLPPSAEDFRRFESDARPDPVAFASEAERLLAHPQFGERWARYWMDVARYADNKGYVFQEDREYPEAYKYRDWLISAFNEDMPYDHFVAQQLAADLLDEQDGDRHLPALGFVTLGRRFLNNKQDIIDDRLDVVTRGLMGMTLACARCHDHKYDPISQADYYAMAGVFLNTDEPGGEPWPHRLADAPQNRESFILLRGSPGRRGDKVERRFVSFLAPEKTDFPKTGSGRIELAQHITSRDNPLTARVIANRIWMRLTGASLVESPSDFGTRCPEPRQKALLDQLAISLMENDWSLKSLVRLIVTSDFYAQSSLERHEASESDPTNELYWRMNRRRLDFEALRDTLLARSGNLDLSLYGKSEPIDTPPFSARRTLYAYIDRQNLPSIFRTFDMASPDSHSPKRAETSVPQQGLFLLNSEFIAVQAETLARRAEVIASAAGSPKAVDWLVEAVLGRPPDPLQREWLTSFITSQSESYVPVPEERWICGYAEYIPGDEQIRDFQRLPAFVRGAWQGGRKLPDKRLGWCILNRAGGHPGNDLQHAVVRRWIAPRDGEVQVTGRLKHPATSEESDGVRGSIIAGGVCKGRWIVRSGETDTNISDILTVRAGQTLELVTDCIGGPSHDSFEWPVKIAFTDGQQETFHSEQEFPGPPAKSLTPWAMAAQALLASNELAFID